MHLGRAIDPLISDEVKGELAVRAGRQAANVIAGGRAIMGAGDLQDVLSCLLFIHSELVLGRPPLDLGNRRSRPEAMFDRLSIERDGDLDMAAAMNIQL